MTNKLLEHISKLGEIFLRCIIVFTINFTLCVVLQIIKFLFALGLVFGIAYFIFYFAPESNLSLRLIRPSKDDLENEQPQASWMSKEIKPEYERENIQSSYIN